MGRMSMAEILDWIEYDECFYDQSWIQHAILCAKIDGAAGDKRPKAERYLPKVKKHKPKITCPKDWENRFDRSLGIAK